MTENTEVRKEKQLAQDLSGSQTELGLPVPNHIPPPCALSSRGGGGGRAGGAVKEKARMPAASTLEDNSVLC